MEADTIDPLVAAALPDLAERMAAAELALGARFADRALLVQALVHRSYVLERERDGRDPLPCASNERLEFLGDAVLGMLVARLAYERFPEYDEGRLTVVRVALVRRSTLALLAEPLGLGELIYMGRLERQSGGRGRATVIAEAFEALLAALYLDGGLAQAERFLYAQLEGRLDALLDRADSLDPKSQLQKLVQARLRAMPSYLLLGRTGPAHDSRFQVEVHAGEYRALGEGSSKQKAEQVAAAALLADLHASLPPTAEDPAGGPLPDGSQEEGQ